MWIGVFTPDLVRRICTTEATRVLREACPAGLFCTQTDIERAGRLGVLFRDVQGGCADVARFNAGLGYLMLVAWEAHNSSETEIAGAVIHPAVQHAVQIITGEPDPDQHRGIGAAGRVERVAPQPPF